MCCFQQGNFIGNIFVNNIEEVWSGPLAKKIRQGIITAEPHAHCQILGCPFYERMDLSTGVATRDDFPTELEIDLPSQHCNIGGEHPSPDNPACIMCQRNGEIYVLPDRTKEICDLLRPYMDRVNSIHIQGVAESFWKGMIFEVVDWLGAKDHHITTSTNGTLLSDSNRRRFLKYKSSSITWSLDAGTAATYKKIRRLDMYDKVVENLNWYSRMRNPYHQRLQIHNTINLININEVEDMVRVAAKAKVDCLEFNATCGNHWFCVNEHNADEFWRAQQKIISAANYYGVTCSFLRNLDLGMSNEHGR